MIILAFESTCDETAVAVVRDGRTVLSDAILSQADMHALYGGVVPEIASRKHVEAIAGLTDQALEQAGITKKEVDAVAVSYAPGLIGAVLVGVSFAKSVAYALQVPLIPVHHIRGHIAANYLAFPDLKPPFLALAISGGNTLIVDVKDYTEMEILGSTRDDAAGECFDKSARSMGLEYPGGVNLDKIATEPDFEKYPMPWPKVDSSELDFSFSGLKTAVINLTHNAEQKGTPIDVPVLSATVRRRVCDILIANTLKAAEMTGMKTIVIAGGVSANSELRQRMTEECEIKGFRLYYPEKKYCGDNAAMVGAQAIYEYQNGNIADSMLNAAATLNIDYLK